MTGSRGIRVATTVTTLLLVIGVSLVVRGEGAPVAQPVVAVPARPREPVLPIVIPPEPTPRTMPLLPTDPLTGAAAVEPAAAPAPESRLRLYGSAAALRLVELALVAADAPSVAFVRGADAAHERSREFDAAVVLSPVGERFAPGGLHWRHLGDFVPVVLAPLDDCSEGASDVDSQRGTFVAVRRWLPLIEQSLPQFAASRGLHVRSERDLFALERVRRREPGASALVSLAALDRAPFFGAATVPLRGVQPSRLAYRTGDYAWGMQVHLVFPQRTAQVERLLDHLLRGAGRDALRRVLI
ncbi:MAG: hypothetical protein NXI31_26250 [bacterium]|nr:hypothetical protein [bacterium]